jgi:MFS family permease
MSQSPSIATSPIADAAPITNGLRAGMLAILTLISVCSHLDRSIVALILEPIKHEFALSDAKLGLIAGLAFAVAHGLASIPLGRLADRLNRRNLIAGCLLLWSTMTALCGMAGSFVQLLLARAGVGAGEAGGQSSSFSLIGDLFPEKNRATALAIFGLSAPVGAMLAGVIGGPVTANFGWRTALVISGIPGLVMFAVLLLFGKEPPRERTAAGTLRAAQSLREVLRAIWRQRSLIHLIIGLTLVSFALTGINSFAVSFFIRYHGMQQHQVGALLGVAGAGSTLVMLCSGILADRLGARDARWRLRLIYPVLLFNVVMLLLAFSSSLMVALPTFLIAFLLGQVWTAPGLATVQSLVPSTMRGTTVAILFMCTNFIGFGLGPVTVGALSDHLAASFGTEGLRMALLLATPLNAWAALHFWLANRTLRADLERSKAAA